MPENEALSSIRSLADDLRSQYVHSFDLPEPNQRLGLQQRAGDPTRQFKHVHQMCLGHVEHLILSAKFKLLGLLDTYSRCVADGSTVACYLLARTILEQCAFAIESNKRLMTAAAKPDANWLPKGEEFFSIAVRLRFATSDKTIQRSLEQSGFPIKPLKPINVMTCVAALASRSEVAHLGAAYDKLCDHIHHNGPSHFTSSAGFYIGSAGIHNGSGGGIITPREGPITRYVYPNPDRHHRAVADTVETVWLASTTCLKVLDETPRSPFRIEKIKQMTGTEHGMVFVGKAARAEPRRDV